MYLFPFSPFPPLPFVALRRATSAAMILPTPISTYHPDAGVVLTAWSDGSVTLTVAPAHPTWQHLCLPADVHLFRPVTRTYRQTRLGIFDASGIVVRSKLASLVCPATEPMRLGEAESLRDGVLREWRALRAFALGFDSDASEQCV